MDSALAIDLPILRAFGLITKSGVQIQYNEHNILFCAVASGSNSNIDQLSTAFTLYNGTPTPFAQSTAHTHELRKISMSEKHKNACFYVPPREIYSTVSTSLALNAHGA